MIDPNGILMVEPPAHTSAEPIIDELTRKMTAAWRKRRTDPDGYRGWHTCSCGAKSDSHDHNVGEGKGLLTNSLCIHYLAFHRADIASEELDKVRALPDEEAEPTEDELRRPKGGKSSANTQDTPEQRFR